MTTTLITHCWQEQYLMPFFVKHHREIFDRAIVLDYASTDNTVDIIKELAPHWEVRQSRNDSFSADLVDIEVMEVESEIEDWKMVLNTTEFMCCRDMPALIHELESEGFDGARIWSIEVVDRQERHDIDSDKPLIEQFHYASNFEADGHQRLLHRMANGQYSLGRHSTGASNPIKQHPESAAIMWFRYAPKTPEMRQRKLQIQHKIPQHNFDRGWGFHHRITDDELEAEWQRVIGTSFNINDDAWYRRVILGRS